ncbi:MAG: hypothetical protein ACRDS9_21635, partial [Pseudonocardiaceae bacterium]
PPAVAGAAPAADAPTAADHGQHLSQVANVIPANGSDVMIAAVVYSAALLAIIGLLSLLGNSMLRARRDRLRPQRAFDQPARSRHAAQRW